MSPSGTGDAGLHHSHRGRRGEELDQSLPGNRGSSPSLTAAQRRRRGCFLHTCLMPDRGPCPLLPAEMLLQEMRVGSGEEWGLGHCGAPTPIPPGSWVLAPARWGLGARILRFIVISPNFKSNLGWATKSEKNVVQQSGNQSFQTAGETSRHTPFL